MKRVGQLFHLIANQASLMAAYESARDGKRNHRACFNFARYLGTNLSDLERELLDGSYRPHDCNRFWVFDGRKQRLIEAPAFRDLVVQHAAYAVVGPLFERRYIDTSFACRKGKGTHQAADWMQRAIQSAPRTAWVLHVDVRKFFCSIDRTVLSDLVRRVIKCPQTLALLDQFMHRDAPTGIPIGNLLSQTYANLYLNSLDHFCKRTLGVADYARYMDDSIMIAPDRATGLQWLEAIRAHLALLGLEISHYSLHPIRRGANFVGFRTWARARFVRPHVISSFRRDAHKGHLPGVISRLGHARRTASYQPLLTYLKDHHADLYRALPQSLRRLHHLPAAAA